MKNLKKACLLLATSMLLVGCISSHKKELERKDAVDKVTAAYEPLAATDFELPTVFSFQASSEVEENGEKTTKIVGVSLDSETCALYYNDGDSVVIGYDANEESETPLEEYTLNYSTDGGETFLEEPLVGEEAVAKYEEYSAILVAMLKGVFAAEATYVGLSIAALETLEATLPDKEEQETGDLAMEISELYYESDSALHLGYSYEYGPLLPEMEDEEQVEDEDGNPVFYIDSESDLYVSDSVAVHFEKYEEGFYPVEFFSNSLIVKLTLGSLVYAGEIFEE